VIAYIAVYVKYSRKMRAQGNTLGAPMRERIVIVAALLLMLLLAVSLFMQTRTPEELSKEKIYHNEARRKKSQSHKQGGHGNAAPCGFVAQGSESERYAGQSQQGEAHAQHEKRDRKQCVHTIAPFLLVFARPRRGTAPFDTASPAGKRSPAPFSKQYLPFGTTTV
jgi:hypothetical protein